MIRIKRQPKKRFRSGAFGTDGQDYDRRTRGHACRLRISYDFMVYVGGRRSYQPRNADGELQRKLPIGRDGIVPQRLTENASQRIINNPLLFDKLTLDSGAIIFYNICKALLWGKAEIGTGSSDNGYRLREDHRYGGNARRQQHDLRQRAGRVRIRRLRRRRVVSARRTDQRGRTGDFACADRRSYQNPPPLYRRARSVYRDAVQGSDHVAEPPPQGDGRRNEMFNDITK